MENQIAVTVTGGNRVDLVKKLRAFADNLDGAPLDETVSNTAKKTKKQAAAPADDFDTDTTEELASDDTDFDSDDTETLEASDDSDEDFTSPPAKKEKAKAKKVTIAEVNEACKARAKAGGKDGRTQVLKILKKHFKTESISEIKPEQYAKVIQAMAVTQ